MLGCSSCGSGRPVGWTSRRASQWNRLMRHGVPVTDSWRPCPHSAPSRARHYLAKICDSSAKALNSMRIARRVEEEHRPLLAGLALEPQVRLDDERRPGRAHLRQGRGSRRPRGPRRSAAPDLVRVHVVAARRAGWPDDVGHDLVAVEVPVDPCSAERPSAGRARRRRTRGRRRCRRRDGEVEPGRVDHHLLLLVTGAPVRTRPLPRGVEQPVCAATTRGEAWRFLIHRVEPECTRWNRSGFPGGARNPGGRAVASGRSPTRCSTW